MIAIVSSMVSLLPLQPDCNGSATRRRRPSIRPVLALALYVAAFGGAAYGQEARPTDEKATGRDAATALAFLGGAVTGLLAHEASHVAFDYAFDARPGIKRVEFGVVPFFAITHREVTRRREFAIASAGFWAQHAVDEWLLTNRPRLRRERGPFTKGVLAFGVLTSVAYGGVALSRAGPPERDTRGMALSAAPGGIDERWIGALVLAPAALDAYRYFAPDARWPVWASRAVKVALVLMIVR